MDIKLTEKNRIESKLNEEFDKVGRRIVFWYDDGGKFEPMLSELSLNAKIYKLEKNNTFLTKYMLEIEDKESNYLVYATFVKPLDEDNHLADTILYSAVFNADAFQMFVAELHIPDKYQFVMKNNKKVFDAADRRQRFSDLSIEHWNEETIEMAILCVLCKARTVSFDEITKCVLMDNVENNKCMSEFAKYGVTELFWKYADKFYGYRADNKNVEHFITSMIMTYANSKLINDEGFGRSVKQYICDKSNNCEVFICNFMNSFGCSEKYDELADIVAKRTNIAALINKMDTLEFDTCDAFEDFDKEVIKRCIAELLNAHDATCFRTLNINRINLHFGKKYLHEYKCLIHAFYMLNIISDYKTTDSVGDAIATYKSKFFGIDRNYRKFYLHYDKLEDNSLFEELKSKVENTYTNIYLRKCTVDWNKLASTALSDRMIKHQQDFYEKNVERFKDRLIVIISDAFRYECATELLERFNECSYDSTLDYMLSTVPSYTQLGMAALLPHRHIEMDAENDYRVLIDGQSCSDISSRNNILCQADKDSIAINYNEVINMKKAELRAAFQGKNVIYIYHDQVDARGDKAATENEVFNACSEAISEIASLIKRLTGNISSTNYIITADHGFIYKRDKIQESDKVLQTSNSKIYLNKRFILSQGCISLDSANCFSMGYLLGQDSGTCVTVPIGSDIFKAKGGGQNYVHGGASLQEMMVPVMKVHTPKTSVEQNSVEIALLSLSRTITNLITPIEFIQTQKISDEVKSAAFRLVFESETGAPITNEEFLMADKKDDKPENRVFKKKFVFKDMKYKKADKFYLVIRDDKTGDEVNRMEFMIDIIFAGGFGF